MTKKKLALLLDECLQPLLAEQIKLCRGTISSLEHITKDHHLANKGTLDKAVVAYAKKNKQIVVTVETRFDEHDHPICTHPGIIVLATKHHELEKGKLFAEFMRSGEKKQADHAVIKITSKGVFRTGKNNEGKIVKTTIDTTRRKHAARKRQK